MKRQLFIVLALLVPMAACSETVETAQSEAPAPMSAPQPGRERRESMKGWDLYIWPQGGMEVFALHEGTNREKSYSEIASKALRGREAILEELRHLKPGQTVTIKGRSWMQAPPPGPANAVRDFGRQIGLDIAE